MIDSRKFTLITRMCTALYKLAFRKYLLFNLVTSVHKLPYLLIQLPKKFRFTPISVKPEKFIIR